MDGNAPRAQRPHQADGAVDHRRGQLQPIVVPHADLIAEGGVGFGRFVDDVAEALAQVDAVVHAMKVDGGEHLAPPRLAHRAVVEPFGLPFDQDVADVEDDGRGRAHPRCSA